MKCPKLYPGSVTYIQKFGSALELNIHIHSELSDGVFVKEADGNITFVRTHGPSLEDIRHIAERISRRAHKWLERCTQEADLSDDFEQNEPLLAACYGVFAPHAQLRQRVVSCPRCNSTMKVISFVTEQPAIRDIREWVLKITREVQPGGGELAPKAGDLVLSE